MPTYEYRCSKCRYEFEKLQAMSEAAVKKCPKCKRLAVRRLISTGVGVIFKGTGFYATDYKNKKSTEEKNKTGSSAKSCSSYAPSPNSCSSCKK